MIVLHERLVYTEVRERAAPVGLEKEAALIAVDDGRKQQGSVELGQELLHSWLGPGLTISPPPRATRSALSCLERPALVDQHRKLASVAGGRGDLDLGPADHKVGVDSARVDSGSGLLIVGQLREARAEREVAGGILVEQRVVK